jgi:hypothetical protein
VWQPPSRLVFTWRNANFAAEESTEVEVLDDAAFSRMMGLWWGDLMTGLREFIETRRPTEERCR